VARARGAEQQPASHLRYTRPYSRLFHSLVSDTVATPLHQLGVRAHPCAPAGVVPGLVEAGSVEALNARVTALLAAERAPRSPLLENDGPFW
jgi:hypothetical protein